MLETENGKHVRFEIVVETLLPHCGGCPAHSLAFCRDVEPDALACLDRAVRHIELAKGQIAVEEGARSAALRTVVSGSLRLFKTLSDGRRLITAFRFPGDAVVGCLSGQPEPAAVQAITPTVLCQLDRQELEPLRAAFPLLGRRLEELTAQMNAADQAHMLTLGRKAPAEKLATFLLEMERCNRVPVDAAQDSRETGDTEGSGGVEDSGKAVQLPMTRQDIADYLGLETETTSRLFSRFRDQGIIALPKPSLAVLRNRAALTALAAGRAKKSA